VSSYRPEIVKIVEEKGEEPTEVIKKMSHQFYEMDSRALADEDHYWALILEQAEYGLYYELIGSQSRRSVFKDLRLTS
jgi:hypothetical protein